MHTIGCAREGLYQRRTADNFMGPYSHCTHYNYWVEAHNVEITEVRKIGTFTRTNTRESYIKSSYEIIIPLRQRESARRGESGRHEKPRRHCTPGTKNKKGSLTVTEQRKWGNLARIRTWDTNSVLEAKDKNKLDSYRLSVSLSRAGHPLHSTQGQFPKATRVTRDT